jgi:hypothetical protein
MSRGLAYGRWTWREPERSAAAFWAVPLFSVARATGHSQVNTGWTVDSGADGKLLIPGWTYKIEYLYVDLGSLDDTDPPAIIIGAIGGPTSVHTRASSLKQKLRQLGDVRRNPSRINALCWP